MTAGARRPVILCVDGDVAARADLARELGARLSRTHEVMAAASAEEALAVVQSRLAEGPPVELVLCAQDLPGMAAERFLERLHEARPEVRTVLLGGRPRVDALVHAINHAGLDRYLERPWAPAVLVEVVERLLEEYRLAREREAERERLERRTRELHSLHRLGRGLGSVSEPDRVLALVAEAACGLSGAARAEVVAQVDTHERPWWSAPAAPPFTVEVRRAVEAQLGRHRAERSSGVPARVPAGALPVPIEHAGALFGWVFLLDPPPFPPDTHDLLTVLTGQAATTLHNLELINEAVRTERLSTIGRMLSSIVHDFRNPMTSIRGYAAVIEEMDIGPDRRKRYAHLVVEETDRMTAMIDELLEFTRGGGAPLNRRLVAVAELGARLGRVLEPDLVARRVSFVQQLDYEGPVAVDPDRLLRALLNIAGNALDAMEAGGTLTFRARDRQGLVELSLVDTGHGIPEELQSRIYEPFFTHGKPRGIGLGMSITRRIVEDHGGTIGLVSAPGKGTSVTVSLPASLGD
ncbi:MAG TPA: ATP-binding protein [Vicinamibacteria bacterium]|nr:ATP-binding protein [Vicinamibacteria bacterium]